MLVVHGLLEDFDEVVQGLLVDLDLLQLKVVDVLVQGFEDVVEVVEVVQGLVELLEEVVHGFDEEEVVHGLLEVVDLQGVEHEVEVRVVAGVQVKVLQLVVVVGLPAVVMRYTSQCFEVVVAGRQCSPDLHSTVGQTGPVS